MKIFKIAAVAAVAFLGMLWASVLIWDEIFGDIRKYVSFDGWLEEFKEFCQAILIPDTNSYDETDLEA